MLASVISAASASASDGGASMLALPSSELQALARHFMRVLAAGSAGPAAASTPLATFCAAVLTTDDVRRTVEPLVSLLVTYASSRLQGSA